MSLEGYIYQFGSVGGTSQGGQNLVSVARTEEAAVFPNLFPNEKIDFFIKKIDITVNKDCSIKINRGSKIPLTANMPYSVDDICAHSIEIDTEGVEYILNYGY